MHWKPSNLKAREAHSQAMFRAMLEDATKSRKHLQLYVFNNSEAIDTLEIGCPESWLLPNGFNTFLNMGGEILPNLYTGYVRKTESLAYSEQNVCVGLLPEFKRAVDNEIRAALEQSLDLRQISEELNRRHVPAASCNGRFSAFVLREHAVRQRLFPVKQPVQSI